MKKEQYMLDDHEAEMIENYRKKGGQCEGCGKRLITIQSHQKRCLAYIQLEKARKDERTLVLSELAKLLKLGEPTAFTINRQGDMKCVTPEAKLHFDGKDVSIYGHSYTVELEYADPRFMGDGMWEMVFEELSRWAEIYHTRNHISGSYFGDDLVTAEIEVKLKVNTPAGAFETIVVNES